LRGLAYHAEDRFSNAKEFRSALRDCASRLHLSFENLDILRREWDLLRKVS